MYHSTSSVCQAAIHANVMTDKGGSASLMFEKVKAEYDGSTRAQITSNLFFNTEKEGHSFVIIGNKMENTSYFVEEYESEEVDNDYDVWEHKRASKGPARWGFNKFPHDPLGEKIVI